MNAMNSKAAMNIKEASPKRGPAAPANSPPPPRIFLELAGMVKKTSLLCLFLFCILALPVQSQATPVPTLPLRAQNPTSVSDCGLPTTWAQFTASATFTMTDDCVFNSWAVQTNLAFLYFTAGSFTINGNGHTITGPSNGYALYVDNAGTVLNLNNVIIREAGLGVVARNGRLNANNVIFRENPSNIVLTAAGAGQIHLNNVQFLNNRGTGVSPYTVQAAGFGSLMRLTNSIFQGNTGFTAIIDSITALQLHGCVLLAGNNAQSYSARSTGITDSSTGACPARGFSYWLSLTPQKKSKKTATPRPSATARPLATTCIDLNQATGIAVRATYGLASGVQCQRLDGGGIGVQAIVDGGFIDAVDIWGYVEQGVEVCFPQAGRLLFLDARMMPRATAALESTVVNGMTCGAIETPGSIVLMPN